MEIKAVVKAAGETHSTGIRPHPYRLTPVYKQRINGKVTQIPLFKGSIRMFPERISGKIDGIQPVERTDKQHSAQLRYGSDAIARQDTVTLMVGHHFLLLKVYAIQSAQSAPHP